MPEQQIENPSSMTKSATTERTLVLTRVGPDFDIARDIPLGPWCFIGTEEQYPDWQELDYIEPFDKPAALSQADTMTRALANQLALKWTDILNARHGRSYSAEYWRTQLILWLVSGAQTTWRRFVHMELLVERYGDQPVRVDVLDEKPNWGFAHIVSFSRHIGEDRDFDLWMNSEILKIVAPPSWTLVPVAPASEHGLVAKPKMNTPFDDYGRVSGLVRRIFGRLCFDSVSGVRLSKILFSLYIKALPKRPSQSKKIAVDKEVFKQFPKAYLDFLDRFLECTLPRVYTDGFLELERAALKNKFVAGRLFVDHLLTLDGRRRAVLAHAQEAGERLVGSQHGCGYGACLSVPWAAEGEYKYDAFITWGWNKQQDLEGNMIPLPSPRLSRTMNSHVQKNNQLIFTGARIFLPDARFSNRPQPTQWFNYRHMKRQFIETLCANAREQLVYRPYLKAEESMQDVKYLKSFFDNLPILEGDLDTQAFDCKLLVLDYPATTMIIGMAANVPTVAFWDQGAWPASRQAEPLNDILKKAGILHDTAQSAARHINDIWDDVPGWWNDPATQQARLQWCDQYARASKVWWWHWMAALWRLARTDRSGIQQ